MLFRRIAAGLFLWIVACFYMGCDGEQGFVSITDPVSGRFFQRNDRAVLVQQSNSATIKPKFAMVPPSLIRVQSSPAVVTPNPNSSQTDSDYHSGSANTPPSSIVLRPEFSILQSTPNVSEPEEQAPDTVSEDVDPEQSVEDLNLTMVNLNLSIARFNLTMAELNMSLDTDSASVPYSAQPDGTQHVEVPINASFASPLTSPSSSFSPMDMREGMEVCDDKVNVTSAYLNESPAKDEPPPRPVSSVNAQGPLSDEDRYAIDSIQWDVPPEVLHAIKVEHQNKHFLYSDELHPEKFYDSIKDLGNTYIGIGTDQGYVFIGWQRPKLAFLVDYDPWVVVMHKIYIAMFKACQTPDCLLHYFDDSKAGYKFIKTHPELGGSKAKMVYRDAFRGITHSLRAIRRKSEKTFMNDQETFDFIKQLIDEGRLVTFQANLLGDKAFASINHTLRNLDAQVGVIYLSNAEQYWGYTRQFKENMSELPYADNALVIRTMATKPFNKDYRYSVQDASVFKAWLAHPEGKSIKSVAKYVKVSDINDIPLTIDNEMPPELEIECRE